MTIKIFQRLSLKSRVTLFTVTIFLICFWSLEYYGKEILRETTQDLLGEQQFTMASFIAAGVHQELDDRLRVLKTVAGTITPAIMSDKAALQAAMDGLPVFQSLFQGRTFAAGTDGIATLSGQLARERIDANLMGGESLSVTIAGGQATIGRPVLDRTTMAPMVVMAVPIRAAEGHVIGALAGVFDLSKSNFLDKLSKNGYLEAGSFRLIAPQHRLVVMTNERIPIMDELPPAGVHPVLDRLVQGHEGSDVVRNRAGVEVLTSAKSIPTADWYVVVELPIEVAFSAFHAGRQRMLMGTILLSLLAAGLTWLMLRRQLAPMLAAASALTAQSDSHQPLQPLPISRQDEIGDLIGGFNRLLAALKQQQEALAASEERFRCLTEMSADFYWESDVDHRLTQRTESKREVEDKVFLETTSIGARRWEIPSLSPDEAGWQSHRAMLERHLPFRHFEISRLRPNGAVHHLSVSGDPIFDRAGNFRGYRGIGSDITDRKQIELALVASQRRLAAVLDGVQSAVITITEHGIVESVNQSAEQLFGYRSAEVVGQNIKLFMPQPYRSEHDSYLDNYRRTGIRKIIGRRREVLGQRKDGSTFPLELGVYETLLNDRKLFIGSISDISFRKQAEAELRIAATAFEAQQGMVITDANSVILRVNQAFVECTGYTSAEIVGQTPALMKSDRHDADFYRRMWDAIRTTGGWQGEIWDRRKNGEVYPKWLTITAVHDERGMVTHYVGAHIDITERKQQEDQLRQLAFFDTLTGLPNRRLLTDRLRQAMAGNRRNGSYGALLFLDLDNFKSLNDTHGHAVGDLLLIEASERLRLCVRQMDTVARFGGDEFVVLLNGLNVDKAKSASHANVVAEKIRIALSEAYRLVVKRDGTPDATVEHHCTASIGVTLFMSHEASHDDILKWADAAMYQAKEAGRNLIRLHEATVA